VIAAKATGTVTAIRDHDLRLWPSLAQLDSSPIRAATLCPSVVQATSTPIFKELHVSLLPFMNAPRRVFAAFAIYSFGLGAIFPRLGEVQSAMGVDEGALGFGLIGAPLGTLISLSFATPFLERIGFRPALLLAIPLLTVWYAIAVNAPTPLLLFLALIPAGLTIGCIEIILNLEADRVEHAIGRRIMNRSHAFWSIGFFLAGSFGAIMARVGLSPELHLLLVVPLVAAAVVVFIGDFQPAPHRPTTNVDAVPRVARPTGPIMVLVAFTVSAMLLEGASIDWSAIYMRDVFGTEAFVGGIAVATFAFFHAAGRFFADGIVERTSPVMVAQVQLYILLAGCLMVTFTPVWYLALVGFGLMGVGSATMFPLAMSAAAQRTDRPAAVNVASLAQISFLVFLLAPPLLGFVAEHFGIRVSFGIGLPLIILSLITSTALRVAAVPKSA
jgi:MFS family permease